MKTFKEINKEILALVASYSGSDTSRDAVEDSIWDTIRYTPELLAFDVWSYEVRHFLVLHREECGISVRDLDDERAMKTRVINGLIRWYGEVRFGW